MKFQVGQVLDEEYYTIHVVVNNEWRPLVDFPIEDVDNVINEYKCIPKLLNILNTIKSKSKEMPLALALKMTSLNVMKNVA